CNPGGARSARCSQEPNAHLFRTLRYGMIPPALGRLGALEKFELTGSKLIG
ncbi:unnamed protein product, partial [Scytosiphon promiscuus]